MTPQARLGEFDTTRDERTVIDEREDDLDDTHEDDIGDEDEGNEGNTRETAFKSDCVSSHAHDFAEGDEVECTYPSGNYVRAEVEKTPEDIDALDEAWKLRVLEGDDASAGDTITSHTNSMGDEWTRVA
jgi:hypothetical protein